ncbi:MAG: 1-acyl-sn-glycerol-3-phosphate acyltransferase [Deltaproteobacteria bacterium]|nr:1-acyl-sn-glycerol-3-phosphate acyltransferase [Deltaproteobacteria bacterium]
MIRFGFSLFFWTFITASSLALFPVAVLLWAMTGPFDRRKVLLHRFTCFWASLYSWFNPAWPVTVTGREKIPRDQACVMVANHLSLVDILILFRLQTHFKWVSKSENFRVPFIGWNMSLNDYIQLKRGDKASVLRMMRHCEQTLAAGSSVMMFPEGTRSPTGRMRSFKTGAFEMALKARTPILPIVIHGTADALPKRGFVLQGRHPIRIEVLDLIPYESFADKSVEELTRDVRNVIAEHVVTDGGDAVAPRSKRAARAARAAAEA